MQGRGVRCEGDSGKEFQRGVCWAQGRKGPLDSVPGPMQCEADSGPRRLPVL